MSKNLNQCNLNKILNCIDYFIPGTGITAWNPFKDNSSGCKGNQSGVHVDKVVDTWGRMIYRQPLRKK